MRALWLIALVAACSGAQTPASAPAGHGSAAPVEDHRPIPPDNAGISLPQGKACEKTTECASGEECFSPDFQPGRGTAPQCEGGRDCGRGMVCNRGDCEPRCTSSSCGTAMRCGSAGLCEPLPCTDARSVRCMQNTRCNASTGQCDRIACKGGEPCDAGQCWNGYCYAHSGRCINQSYCCPP